MYGIPGRQPTYGNVTVLNCNSSKSAFPRSNVINVGPFLVLFRTRYPLVECG